MATKKNGLKKKIIKHLKEDQEMFGEEIKEDQKLVKKLRKVKKNGKKSKTKSKKK